MHSIRQAATRSGLIGVVALSLCTLVKLRAEEPFVHWATTGPYSHYPGATAISPAGEFYTYFKPAQRLDEGLLRFSPTGELVETNKLVGVVLAGLVFDKARNRYYTGAVRTNGPGPFILAKFDASNEPSWTRGWEEAGDGGSGEAIALNPQGGVHVAGTYVAGDSAGMFVRKYNEDGLLLWSTRIKHEKIGPSYDAYVYGLAVDTSGHTVVYGFLSTGVTDFSGTVVYPGSSGHAYGGDWFLARYRPDGALDWVKLGYAKAAAVDRSGNIYASLEWPKDDRRGLVKLGPNGDVIWSKEFDAYLGGIAMDRDDKPVLCGDFNHTVTFGQFTLNADISVNEWYDDIFVAKVNADGSFKWAMAGGGNDHDRVHDVVCDGRGNIYLTGWVRFSVAYFDNLTLVPFGPDESTIFAAKLSEAPPLHISASPGTVDLTWPSKATDYVLEASPSITGASWNPVEGAPVGWGRDQTLSVATDSPAKFFRLRQP